MRANMRNIFVNLSRRSQSLVERQLKLMEELEKYEEDPDQLANLFKLDHLATRMRRNNENLMVLSGGDVARRFHKPIPLTDVLRAAAAEIEQYQRVMVHTAPNAEVVGYVASDLVRSAGRTSRQRDGFLAAAHPGLDQRVDRGRRHRADRRGRPGHRHRPRGAGRA